MDRTVAALTRHYPRREEASQQAFAVLTQYPSLVNPEQSDFTYDDGRVELLLSLTGVLPVPIGSNTYHCPVAIWLPLDFPSRPPIVYVLPNETLQIRKGKHVDANGQVSASYLENWERKSEGCSLLSLINELIPIFSARYPLAPVQAKPKPQPSASPAPSSSQPPPRPAPPTSASAQTVPPRPAPPPSASPSGWQSSMGGPPRPPLPNHSATTGPAPPSRPQSMAFDQPARSLTCGPDGRTGSPVAPPRPPPPRGVQSNQATSSGAPPPPAYPAQHPPAPPGPPPQRPLSATISPVLYSPQPPTHGAASAVSPLQQQPPPPPAYPAGQGPANHGQSGHAGPEGGPPGAQGYGSPHRSSRAEMQGHAQSPSAGSMRSYQPQREAPAHRTDSPAPSEATSTRTQTVAYDPRMMSPHPPHMVYDRGQTQSPAPLSDLGSVTSSAGPAYRYDSPRGPRPPAPPSEYSATGEYGSYIPPSSASTASGPPYAEPGVAGSSVASRAPAARNMTVSYETQYPQGSYAEDALDPAFEPVIEPRQPPVPPQIPVQPQQPPSRQNSVRSEYTATSSAFVPQPHYGQPDSPRGSVQSAAMSHGQPPLPAPTSTVAYESSSYAPYGSASYGSPYAAANGRAPAQPAALSPSIARAARKARPPSAKPINILDADEDQESSAPSSPATVTGAHATANVTGSDSVSNAGGPTGAASRAPPVPPNPALLALRTRVHSKLASATAQLAQSTEAELARLDLMRVDLEKARPAIEDEMARLEAVRSVCGGVRDRYAEVVAAAQQRLREYEARGEGVDVDEIICGSTVVYTQLLDLVAEDAALEDTIYALGRGLNSGGTANINLEQFLKRVRILAKEQFVVRATINKIQQGLASRRRDQPASASGARGSPAPVANGGTESGGRGTPVSGA